MQTFTSDFPLNSVQNLPVITSESEEKFDFSSSNVFVGLQICKKLDRTFGKHNEDHNSTLEITASTTRVIYSKISASTLSDEVFQDEDEAKSSTHSIRN